MPPAADVNYWPLLGVAVVIAGFALRRNPVLVVVSAGVVSGFASGKPFAELLTLIGRTFVENRLLLLLLLTFPVIGLLERFGLRERARAWISGIRGLTVAHFLITYLGLRQILSMVGLTQVAGHVQTVRPLVAPMSEAAAERSVQPPPKADADGSVDAAVDAAMDPAASVDPVPAEPAPPRLDERQRAEVRAMAAATDNVGLFFGEDVFIAFGAVLLIQGFYASNGIELEPLTIALWALPTAIIAFCVHSLRLWLMQRRLRRECAARRIVEGADAQG